MTTPGTHLLVFISHSTSDSELAQAVVHLIEKALKLSARQIRCTSLPGYKLPVGADAEEQLRRETFEAKAFLGLITPASMQSHYVLFELGARWGANRHLAPLIARGTTVAQLRAPLSTLNALDLGAQDGVIQFIQDLAEYLAVPLEPMASFQAAIKDLLAAAAPSATDAAPTSQPPAERSLFFVSPEEQAILIAMTKCSQSLDALVQHLGASRERTNYHLTRLLEVGAARGYLLPGGGGPFYGLEQKGREYLVFQGLL